MNYKLIDVDKLTRDEARAKLKDALKYIEQLEKTNSELRASNSDERKIDIIYGWVVDQLTKEKQICIDEPSCDLTYAEITENILVDLGVSRALSGFNYIVWAVDAIAKDETALRGITKYLYADGAEVFGTTPAAFDSGIRHIVDVAVRNKDKATPDAIYIFGDEHRRERIVPKTFLAILAAEVKKRKKMRKFDI